LKKFLLGLAVILGAVLGALLFYLKLTLTEKIVFSSLLLFLALLLTLLDELWKKFDEEEVRRLFR